MAHGRPGISHGATPSTRAFALAACMIAIGLMVWRGGDILTRAPASPGPLSQTESALLSVAEAVAGQGHVRVSLARQPGRGRQVLVLLDEKSAVEDATLVRLITSAAGLSEAGGDRVDLQRVAFAPGVSAAPRPADWAELSLLALLAGLTGWLGLKAGGPKAAGPVEVVREVLPARMAPQLTDPAKASVPARSGEAADLARNDPARAADVVRGWMGTRGDAA